MSIEANIIEHDTYLEVVVTGTYDMQEAIDRFPNVISACKSTGLSRVVIDFRDLVGIPAATQKIIYAFGIQDHYENYIANGGAPL